MFLPQFQDFQNLQYDDVLNKYKNIQKLPLLRNDGIFQEDLLQKKKKKKNEVELKHYNRNRNVFNESENLETSQNNDKNHKIKEPFLVSWHQERKNWIYIVIIIIGLVFILLLYEFS